MMYFFCPSCWREVSEGDKVCPFCNYDLREHSLLSYEDKLILGVNHPVKDIRKTIVFLIGQKKLKKAVPELEKLFQREDDIFILIEIIRALNNIGVKKSEEVKKRLHEHPLLSKFFV